MGGIYAFVGFAARWWAGYAGGEYCEGRRMELPGIVVTGASGRMGRMLVGVVLASDRCRLVGVLERDGHDWVGRDVGEAMGGAPVGVEVTSDPLRCLPSVRR